MILKILFAVLILLTYSASQAQDLSDCKNPCKKTRIIQSGPLIGLRTIDLADSQYVRVIEVVKHGASQKIGILLNDTLTHFNGKVIQSMKYFIAEVAKLNPGDTVTVIANRMGVVSEYRFPLGAAQTRKVTEIVCCDPEPVFNEILFMLIPDVAQKNLSVSAAEVIYGEVLIHVLDINGTLLKKETVKESRSNFATNIDISDLPKGIYFIKIFVDKTQYTKRFVKEQ